MEVRAVSTYQGGNGEVVISDTLSALQTLSSYQIFNHSSLIRVFLLFSNGELVYLECDKPRRIRFDIRFKISGVQDYWSYRNYIIYINNHGKLLYSRLSRRPDNLMNSARSVDLGDYSRISQIIPLLHPNEFLLHLDNGDTSNHIHVSFQIQHSSEDMNFKFSEVEYPGYVTSSYLLEDFHLLDIVHDGVAKRLILNTNLTDSPNIIPLKYYGQSIDISDVEKFLTSNPLSRKFVMLTTTGQLRYLDRHGHTNTMEGHFFPLNKVSRKHKAVQR